MKSNLFTLLDQYSDEQCLLLKEAIENKFKVVTQNGNQVSKSWGRSELIYIKSLTAIMDELFTDSSSGYFQDAEIFINKYMSNFQYKHNLGGIFNYLLDQRLLKVQFNKIQPIIEKPMDNFNQQTVGAGRVVTNFGGAVSLMQKGIPVCRLGWHTKGIFVFMQVPSVVPMAVIPKMSSLPDIVKEMLAKRNADLSYQYQFAVAYPDNRIYGWSPSPTDALAEDWVVYVDLTEAVG